MEDREEMGERERERQGPSCSCKPVEGFMQGSYRIRTLEEGVVVTDGKKKVAALNTQSSEASRCSPLGG